MKYILTLLVSLLFCMKLSAQSVEIAINGNSYITSQDKSGVKIGEKGIEDWTNPTAEVSTYFKLSSAGDLKIALKAHNGEGQSKAKIVIGRKSFIVDIADSKLDVIEIGEVMVKDTGYIKISIQGLEKTGATYGEVYSYILSGEAVGAGVVHCASFEPYWTSRGPSVHLKYPLPVDFETEYFYNEVTVTKGNDPVGSYYMACGFGEGYFGIQVNSPTERRVLFSVWSPFETQDPKLIPDSLKIRLLEKGEGVTVGEFGNEGSGGQSFMRYNWLTGNTYKFLMRVRPDGKNNTIYTAYFYAPEKGKWQLIASFLRPQTNTYYKSAYSFLENFVPNNGYVTRRVEFSNQWARSSEGEWREITDATFTFDATARAGVRKDYGGGVDKNRFYLKNCGFFNQSTAYNTKFSRKATSKKPETDNL